MFGRLIVCITGLVVATLVIAACSGGGDDGDEQPTAAPTSEATSADEEVETPAAEGSTLAIGDSFWHAGWEVRLGDAVFTPGDVSGSVTIDAEFVNLSDSTSAYNSQTVLTRAAPMKRNCRMCQAVSAAAARSRSTSAQTLPSLTRC
jgi:hypothetical protein